MYVVGAWLLLQFGEVMIEIMELPLWMGRALVVILALGFPFVLLMAWVFDASTQTDAQSAHNNQSSNRKIDTAIIVVLAVALGTTFLFYDRAPNNTPTVGNEILSVESSPVTVKESLEYDSKYLLVGNLVDFTGATGTSGEAWGQAIIDTANWVNENGGIAGKLFDLDTIETSYLVRRALPAYDKWLTQDVIAIQGFGTNIGLALREKVAENEIPYFSSAMAASFTAPNGSPGIAAPAPYNFFYGPSYSDACRGLLHWAHKTIGKTAASQAHPAMCIWVTAILIQIHQKLHARPTQKSSALLLNRPSSFHSSQKISADNVERLSGVKLTMRS